MISTILTRIFGSRNERLLKQYGEPVKQVNQLEPSIAAYHLAFGPTGDLFVTGPTTSSFDSVYRIDPHGSVNVSRCVSSTGTACSVISLA